MRFIVMHKNDPGTEAGVPPPMELVQKMGEFIGEHAANGRFIDGAGLAGSGKRTRLRFRDGKCSTMRGPYRGEQELPATMLLLKVETLEQGLGWAERYGKILVDGELELGKVNEPWDIGLLPVPENPPLQLLLIDKADAATEAGGRTAAQKAALTRLRSEMRKAGVLVRTYDMEPSARARRLQFTNNDLQVIDGPFAESKELIGGFSVMELADLDEAVALSRRYAAILGGTLQVDVRVVSPEDAA